jgi:hypothetical protein
MGKKDKKKLEKLKQQLKYKPRISKLPPNKRHKSKKDYKRVKKVDIDAD